MTKAGNWSTAPPHRLTSAWPASRWSWRAHKTLSDVYLSLSELDAAIASVGPRHPYTLIYRANTARALARVGRPREAAGMIQAEGGHWAKAVETYEDALRIYKDTLGHGQNTPAPARLCLISVLFPLRRLACICRLWTCIGQMPLCGGN